MKIHIICNTQCLISLLDTILSSPREGMSCDEDRFRCVEFIQLRGLFGGEYWGQVAELAVYLTVMEKYVFETIEAGMCLLRIFLF